VVVTMSKIDLAGKLDDARARVEAEAPPDERGLAKYATLTRKDARIREDQDAALTALAKALMQRRRTKRERITANTLVRVAVDLLLAHADDLRGSTEDQLRISVTSALPKFRSPELPNSRSSEDPESRSPELRDFRCDELCNVGCLTLAHSRTAAVCGIHSSDTAHAHRRRLSRESRAAGGSGPDVAPGVRVMTGSRTIR